MLVTLDGMVRVPVSPVHWAKAFVPMEVTEEGIVREVRFVSPDKQ